MYQRLLILLCLLVSGCTKSADTYTPGAVVADQAAEPVATSGTWSVTPTAPPASDHVAGDLSAAKPQETLAELTQIIKAHRGKLDLGSLQASHVVTTQLGEIPRQQRWELHYPPGNTVDMYARQLDFFHVELGAVGGSREVTYASGFTKAKPDTRVAPPTDEQRLYMSWQFGALRELDTKLLERAGVDTKDKIIVQFYPSNIEDELLELELKAAGTHGVQQIRKTAFGIKPVDKDTFVWTVLEQQYR